MDDGSFIDVLGAVFEDENNIIQKSCSHNSDVEPTKLTCKLSFKSSHPVSFASEIVFIAGESK